MSEVLMIQRDAQVSRKVPHISSKSSDLISKKERDHRSRLSTLCLFVLLFSLWGCDGIQPNNPFDPEAPTGTKLLGQVSGRITFSEIYPSDLLDDVNVELRRLSELDTPFMEGVLESGGQFLFEDLEEGRYQLRVELNGFASVRYALILGIGELIDLGSIFLEERVDPNTGDVSVGVEGVAQRALSAEMEHGGILVEALNTPFSTITNSDGRFYLPLPPGDHILRFSTDHYQSARRFDVLISPDRIQQLEEIVILDPDPSQIRGSVSLDGQLDNVPISSVIVRLLESADTPLMDAIQTTTLDATGRFIFDDVPVQSLWVSVACEDYYPQTRPTLVEIGAVIESGHFDLRSFPTPEVINDAPLRGQAQLQDRDSHEGLIVEVRRASVLIASVGTETTGEYALNLPTADYTLSFSAAFYLPQTLDIVWDEEDLRFEVEGAPLSGRPPIILEPELSARLEGDLYSPLPVIERGPWPEVSTLVLTGERGVFELNADETGHFAFEDLHPGLYGLEINVIGHLPTTRIFDLSPEGIILEDPLRMIPLPPEVPAEIRGRSLLAQGAVEDGTLAAEHSGVIVIARQILEEGQVSVDVAGSAVSNAAGEYRITVNRQDYQLSFSSDGYVPRSIGVFWSEDNLRFEVEEEDQHFPLDGYTVVLGQNLGADGDVDLDGVENAQDNCPNLFNPPRIYGDPQEDLDGDGEGDPCDLDQDGDSLTDIEEILGQLDPRDPDTDGDSLGDGLEVNLLSTSGILRDTDFDGRTDEVEVVPSEPDTPGVLDLSLFDTNSDGIFSLEEAIDQEWIAADYDGDGLIDALESLITDQDGDGAFDQIDGPGPDGDFDGDGFRNGQRNELGACVDPISCDPCPNLADFLDPDRSTPEVPIPLDTDRDGEGDVCDFDDDNDGEPDQSDVCRLIADPEQIDTDLDGRGDACDDDDDNDGLTDDEELALGTLPNRRDSDLDQIADGDGVRQLDNCPTIPNTDQRDHDQDQVGDACDPDDDEDGLVDVNDNCPFHINPSQINVDGDGFGDACDLDDDNDGVLDENDNCPVIINPSQADNDLEGQGNACDEDDDNDGVLDEDDNCVLIFNPDQRNTQGGVLGDACSLDIDGDGIIDGIDNCLESTNSDQSDLDLDGFGDVCDADLDGDLLETLEDNCPFVFNPPVLTVITDNRATTTVLSQLDFDNDGLGDACDDDDDNDGIIDEIDSCPYIDNVNSDIDRDQVDDACDVCVDVYDPLQRDLDADGLGDVCDEDVDNDQIIDLLDNCPTRYNPVQLDLDGDGVGDDCQHRFENMLSDRDVQDLAQFEDEIWVASESGGLTRWTWDDEESSYNKTRYTTSEGAPSNRVYHLAIDQFGNLKAITDKGMATHYYESDTWDLESFIEGPESCRDGQPVIPWAAAIDLDIYRADDTIYTAFKGVVIRYKGGQLTCWKRGDDLPDLPINAVDVNPFNGDVWVSTDGGAYRYNQQSGWLGFTRPILRSDRVQQVGFTDDGRVWVLSREGTSSYVILDGEIHEQHSGSPSAEEMATITESRFGVHSSSNTIWYFDADLPGLVSELPNGASGDPEITFHPLPLDNRGAPLITGPNGQLLHQGYQLVLTPSDEEEGTPVIGGGRNEGPSFALLGELGFGTYIGPAPESTRSEISPLKGMWSANSFGVKLNDTLYVEESGLPSNRVRDVAIDTLDQVWVATAKGLVHRRLGRFYAYYPGGQEGDIDYNSKANEIYAVEVDRENRAWFGTEAGVFYFDGVRIRPVYGQFNQSLPPTFDLFVDHLGTLWAGTSKGLFRRLAKPAGEVGLGEAPFEFEHLSLIPGFEPMLTRVKGSVDGRIYAASPRGFFVRSPDGQTQQYSERDGLPSNRVHDLFVIDTIPDPLVWISTDTGLTRYVASLRELNSEELNEVVSNPYPPFSVDASGILWVTLEGGYIEKAPSDSSSRPVFLFPFEVSRSEITNTQWAHLSDGPAPPLAQAYLPRIVANPDALSTILPAEMSLPTQSEWEVIALGDRLQHHTLYPWVESYPWFEGPQCERVRSAQCGQGVASVCLHPLGQTSQGLCDVGGNATEWALGNDGWVILGGGALSDESELRLTQRVSQDDVNAEVRAPSAARGFRLVKRTRSP